jgi:hypothetical protein
MEHCNDGSGQGLGKPRNRHENSQELYPLSLWYEFSELAEQRCYGLRSKRNSGAASAN